MNPAQLSPSLARLFVPGVVVAQMRGPGDPDLLNPEEKAGLGRAVPIRVKEFAAGRLCARRALAELGIQDFVIRVGDDRQPIWPQTITGSITHTADFCAAAVALRQICRGVGIDCETVADVNPEIWPGICGPAELAWIRSLPPAAQRAAAALIFCAKEAFYKCQYPLTAQRLGFQDARIDSQAPAEEGEFVVYGTKNLAIFGRSAGALRGRYAFHQGRVTAGIVLAAEGGAQ